MSRKRNSKWMQRRRRLGFHARVAVPCPDCGSLRTHVTTSKAILRPVRYHACSACGCTFKSVEVLVLGELLTA